MVSKLGSESAVVRIDADAWLAAQMGHAVFKLDFCRVEHRGSESHVREAIEAHACQHAGAMYYAKVGTDEIDAVRVLGAAGFYVVDASVTLEARRTPAPRAAAGVRVVDAAPAHEAAVLDIAETCFRYSRFHLDPAVPRILANRIKREWIASYFRGLRGDRLFVALADERPAGFLAALTPDARTARIDLIGVAEAASRRGIGAALVSSFTNQYGRTHSCLEVATQLANVPSLRLYASCGFVVAASQYVLHLHSGGGACEVPPLCR